MFQGAAYNGLGLPGPMWPQGPICDISQGVSLGKGYLPAILWVRPISLCSQIQSTNGVRCIFLYAKHLLSSPNSWFLLFEIPPAFFRFLPVCVRNHPETLSMTSGVYLKSRILTKFSKYCFLFWSAHDKTLPHKLVSETVSDWPWWRELAASEEFQGMLRREDDMYNKGTQCFLVNYWRKKGNN